MGMKTLFQKSIEPKYLVIITIFLCACSSLTDEKHFYVDRQLTVFVDRFYKEANQRGIILQRQDLIMAIKNNGFYAGAGPEGVTKYSLSEIDIDPNFTIPLLNSHSGVDSLNVEYVVFHELAHYLLHRQHLDDSHYTIMTPDDFYKSDFQTDSVKRKELIDELFTEYM